MANFEVVIYRKSLHKHLVPPSKMPPQASVKGIPSAQHDAHTVLRYKISYSTLDWRDYPYEMQNIRVIHVMRITDYDP